MVNILISGKLHAAPETRLSKTGREFVTARAVIHGEGGSTWASVVAFNDEPMRALLALSAGEHFAAVGTAKISAYADKQGQPAPSLDVVADHVMTVYHAERKRRSTMEAAQ